MSRFQIFTQDEIADLRIAGKILRECLQLVSSKVREGISTAELDDIAEQFIRSHKGATPAFKGYHNYPATLCTSINDECVHGIPGSRKLKNGDIVSLDGGVIYGGLYTDACVTVPVGEIPQDVQTFLQVSKESLEAACALVQPGARIGDISSCIEQYLVEHGYQPVRNLTGHGLGTTLHQFPDIPNRGKKGTGPALPKYTIIAIEPITSMGGDGIRDGEDGWTICTADGSLSAHFEHTILVTPEGHEILA